MATVKDPLKVAQGELGNTESPAGSNRTKYGKWMGLDGQPWCMSFVQYCFAMAGYPLPYKTGSCSALLTWYRKNKPECIVTAPKARDIVIYNFGHTGILESAATGTVTVVEGNTSAGAAGSQDNGGGVFTRTRSRTLVQAFIRPFDKYEEDDMDINTMISQMTDEQAYKLLEKAKKYAAKRAEPEWSKKEGHWKRMEDAKLLSGAPEDLLRRDELAAVLGRAGLV
ncbi:MAG: CHAP domain-containing protein [Oscillibacter sp.]|nr:CHAP domain-containing protein [Oscillibacter sp.]